MKKMYLSKDDICQYFKLVRVDMNEAMQIAKEHHICALDGKEEVSFKDLKQICKYARQNKKISKSSLVLSNQYCRFLKSLDYLDIDETQRKEIIDSMMEILNKVSQIKFSNSNSEQDDFSTSEKINSMLLVTLESLRTIPTKIPIVWDMANVMTPVSFHHCLVKPYYESGNFLFSAFALLTIAKCDLDCDLDFFFGDEQIWSQELYQESKECTVRWDMQNIISGFKEEDSNEKKDGSIPLDKPVEKKKTIHKKTNSKELK